MFVLQSASPSVVPGVVVLVVGAVVGLSFGFVGDAVVRRLSNPVRAYRLLYAGALVPLAAVTYALLASLGFGTAVTAGVATPGLLGRVVGGFVELLAAGTVFLVAYAPTVRGIRRVREVDLSTTRAVVRMARYVLGMSVVFTGAVVPIRIVLADGAETDLVLVGVVLAVVAGAVLISPWLVPLLRSTRTPEGATADRVERLCVEAGLDVRDVVLLETNDEETATAFVRGPPGARRLFLGTTFLDAFEDDTARALLAVQAGRLDARVFEARLLTALGVAGGVTLAVTALTPVWSTLGATLGAVLLGTWAIRRGIKAADGYAAEQTDPESVRRAFERYAAVHSMEPDRRRVPNPFSTTVPLGDRLDRLEAR
jgi:STE24 endopeptidase